MAKDYVPKAGMMPRKPKHGQSVNARKNHTRCMRKFARVKK